MAKLTATSYTILGWLALQPWSTYELAKQIQRNLRFFWPRAESQIYEEPRNLVKLGLATAEQTHVGKRPRTVYRITPAGRQALAAWIEEPSDAPMLWFDGLVRLFFGNFGSTDGLLAALDTARARADEIQQAGATVAGEYLSGSAPFPERIHCSGIVFDFLWNFAELLRDWADRSADEISHWEDTEHEGKEARALALFSAALATKRIAPVAENS